MKECKYCRTKYDDNLSACPNCGGTRVVTEQELAGEEALIQREAEYREKANAVTEMKKKGLIGALVTAIVCIIVVIAMVSYNANKPLSNGMSKNEGEEILAKGIADFDNGDYESAMECFQQLPSDSKQYEEAQSMLLKSKDSYRSEILNRIDSYIGNGEFDSAFALINQANGILLEDADLQTAYDKAYSEYQDLVLKQVDSYVTGGQHEVALEYLVGVLAQYPNDTMLQDAYNNTLFAYQNAVRSDVMQQAEDYVANGDYIQAISVIESAVDKIGQDAELVAQLNVYRDTYKNGILQQASIAYDTDGYEGVMSLLGNAIRVLPNDEDLSREYELWKSRKPVLLTDIDIFSGNAAINPSDYNKDNYGEIYSNSLALSDAVEYYIGKEYAIFDATIYVTDVAKDFEYSDYRVEFWDSMTISVYGDDKLLYTKTGFNPKDKPLDITVDVTDVEFLKIVYAEQFYGFTLVAFGDLTLGW